MPSLPIAAGFVIIFIGTLLLIIESFVPFFSGRSSRVQHVAYNLLFVIVNVLPMFLLSSLTILILDHIAPIYKGIRMLDIPNLIQSVIILLLMDLWLYSWHRVNHRVKFFWNFHRVHHLDMEMDVSTAFRTHFAELCFSELLRLPFLILIGAQAGDIVIYNLILSIIILFHHSNIKLPEKIDLGLQWVIASPNYHRVHHSNIQSETDSNYGGVLSVWDRVFKSFKLRSDLHAIIYGIEGTRNESKSFLDMIKQPFTRVSI